MESKQEISDQAKEIFSNAIIESTPSLLVAVDEKGSIVFANPAAEKLFGYSTGELLGLAIEELVPERFRHEHTQLREHYMKAPEARPIGTGRDLVARRKDGSELPVEISLIPKTSSNGIFVLATVIDITERRHLEEERERLLSEAQAAVKLRDDFLAIASHELKTPITSLKLQLELIEESIQPEKNIGPSPRELAQSLALSLRQINSLSALIESLLDISRLKTGKFVLSLSEFNLTDLVKSITTQLSPQINAAKIHLNLHLEESLVGRWVSHRIERVLENLISNAFKYATQCDLYITTTHAGYSAKIMISDSGPGISEDILPIIF
ncbi:MAG: PAS domain S-box protein, partial [Pseudobdellovibrionaceae bacterium]